MTDNKMQGGDIELREIEPLITNGQPVVGGSGERRSGTQDDQESYFKKKICIKFLPSVMGLNEFKDIQHLNSEHKRENIRCKCGLPYKDHDQRAKQKDRLILRVEELLNDGKDGISPEQFTGYVYDIGKDEQPQKGSNMEPTDITKTKWGQELLQLVANMLKNKTAIEEKFTDNVYVGEERDPPLQRGYRWNPNSDHTMLEVVGAEIGKIEFQMSDNATSTSEFTRLSNGTDKDVLKWFLKNNWKLLDVKPKLVISIIGTTLNKTLADKLVESIMKISRFVSVIILTSGLESDIVAKKIGDAVIKAQRWTTEAEEQSKAKIKCVGITTWGSLEDKLEKVQKNLYRIKDQLSSPFVLNPGHSYFLLVDNGTKQEIPKDLNKFLVEMQKQLKDQSLSVLNLILGKDKDARKTVEITENLLSYHFPVTFLQHAGKYLDDLIDGVLLFRENEVLDVERFSKDKHMAEVIENFLNNQVIQDAKGQKKNVITVCELLTEDSINPEVETSLEAAVLKTLTLPLFVTARVNNKAPDSKLVLQVLVLANSLRCWEVSMNELLTYKYGWTKEEETKLKETFKNCLLQDRPEVFTVFDRVGWCKIETFLTLEMLAKLYSDDQDLLNDPLQVVFKREKLSDDNNFKLSADEKVKLIAEKKFAMIKEIVHMLMLPDCYMPKRKMEEERVKGRQEPEPESERNQEEQKGKQVFKYPYKELLLWAVLSKKWKLVNYILYKQKKDILVWFLATAYLCKAVALGQMDLEIKTEYKEKQRAYEKKGKRLLEILAIQHGSLSIGDQSKILENTGEQNITSESQSSQKRSPGDQIKDYMHQSLKEPSTLWGGLCAADFALLGNFKTFVSSEAFHNYVVKGWKGHDKDPVFCQPRVKFYTHWVCYMIMVLTFCAAIVSRVHYVHHIWLISWIFCYELGEAIARSQQQKNVRFGSKKKQLLLIVRKYLHLLLLFLFLIGGFVCTILGTSHWGGMLYGLACLILILYICEHFLSRFHLIAPQISILKKAFKEILTFMILIILLIWSVAMIFHAVLCLDERSATTTTEATTDEIAPGGWFNTIHAAWFLYLSLYGDYSFELNVSENGHLSCVADKQALMWVSCVLIGLHILIGNVLLMNLLVSVISTKTEEQRKSDLVYVWKSNWYKLTLHYKNQTILPPPFNLGELCCRLVYYYCCKGKCGQVEDQHDARLLPQSSTQKTTQNTRKNRQRYLQEALKTLSDESRLEDSKL